MIRIPTLTGLIERRILINYSVDENALSRILPKPFKPKLVKGKGIAGICLIRLKNVRPKGLPGFIGLSSENGAHRIAVEWLENGITKEGVYIPRRDTSSRINSLAGGQVFPGVHHLANFKVEEVSGKYSIGFISDDDVKVSVQAKENNVWNKESVFENLEAASAFFKNGSVGYSPNGSGLTCDGLELKTDFWSVAPLEVEEVKSTFFENTEIFPLGSVQFDNALLMKDISHEWCGLKNIEIK